MKPLAFSVVLLYGFSMDKKCVCTVHIINVARSRLIFYRSMQPTLCSDDSASCSKHALDSCSMTGSSSLCEVSFS